MDLNKIMSNSESNDKSSSKQHSDSKKLQCVGLSSDELLLFVSVVFVGKQGQNSEESWTANTPPRHSQVLSQTQTFRTSHQPFRSKDHKYQQYKQRVCITGTTSIRTYCFTTKVQIPTPTRLSDSAILCRTRGRGGGGGPPLLSAGLGLPRSSAASLRTCVSHVLK